MVDHACKKGLTIECFKAYPSFARQAIAYRMLYTLVPVEVIVLLPNGLGRALISPETSIPTGIEFPPGWVVFPEVVFPPGWTLRDPPPPGVFPPPVFSPLIAETGGSSPIFIPPFEAGPVHIPAPSPAGATISIDCNGVEQLVNADTDWLTVRDTATGASYTIIAAADCEFVKALYIALSYNIIRTVFRFPLTQLPTGANVTSGYVSIKLFSGDGIRASIQRAPNATWEDPGDYLSFEGDPDGIVTLDFGENKFILTSDSQVYVTTKAGGVCYFISREYDHDFLDSAPLDGEEFTASCYTQYAADPSNWPKLVLTYV